MNSLSYKKLKKELRAKASPQKAKLLQGYFKTGQGEYAEGDVFLGVITPDARQISQKYKDLDLKEVIELLHSKIHEERSVALQIMIKRFQAGIGQAKIFELYLKNTKYINNWDLVDISCHKIVGAHLSQRPKDILYKLARSKNLWERRIAVISTFNFISRNKFSEALKIAQILLHDEHDLIHKAVGWMLREVGKRDLKAEEEFLKKYYKVMPRTMLRYAIEKFPEVKRQRYLTTIGF